MKTITKFIAIATVTFMLGISSLQAQDMVSTTNTAMGWRLGFGLNGGVFKDNSALDYGYGADIRLQYDLAKAVSLTATGGYTRLVQSSDLLPDIDFIPVKGGVKVFPIGGMYLSTEAGAGFGIKDGAKTNFIYSGGLGYAFMRGLDIGARYEGYVNDASSSTYFKKTGQFALRLAYGFKL